jgi:hypothetical protein
MGRTDEVLPYLRPAPRNPLAAPALDGRKLGANAGAATGALGLGAYAAGPALYPYPPDGATVGAVYLGAYAFTGGALGIAYPAVTGGAIAPPPAYG